MLKFKASKIKYLYSRETENRARLLNLADVCLRRHTHCSNSK